jgi:hypothetical protein
MGYGAPDMPMMFRMASDMDNKEKSIEVEVGEI